MRGDLRENVLTHAAYFVVCILEIVALLLDLSAGVWLVLLLVTWSLMLENVTLDLTRLLPQEQWVALLLAHPFL